MAIVAERLVIEIRTEADRATREMSRLNDQTKKNQKSAKGLGGAWKAFKALGIAGAVIGAAKALGSLATAGFKAAAQFEVMTTEFAVLNGSMETAEELMGDLREFAAMTPMSVEAIADSAKQLQSFGSDLEDVQGQIEVLGNVSLGNEQKLQRLTLAFGKIQARGKASMEEINQLLEAGVPILDQLATNFETTERAIFDMISAGEVGFSDVERALTDLQSEGGMFEDGMQRLAGTFQGRLSTAMDNFKNLGASLFDPIIDDAGRALTAVTNFVSTANLLVESTNASRQYARDIRAARDEFGDFNNITSRAAAELLPSVTDALESARAAQERLNDETADIGFYQRRLLQNHVEAIPELEQQLALIERQAASYLAGQRAAEALQNQNAANARREAELAAAANRYNELWASRLTLSSDLQSELAAITAQQESLQITEAEANTAREEAYANALANVRATIAELNEIAAINPIDDLIAVQGDNELTAFLTSLITQLNGVEEAADNAASSITESTRESAQNSLALLQESITEYADINDMRVADARQTAEELAAIEEQLNRARMDVVGNTFDLISTLIDRNVADERKAAQAKKLIAIAEAGINIAQGITAALSTANIPLATLIGISGALQIATIAATPIPGAQMGGSYVVNPGNERDTGLLRVNQGEEINVTPTRQARQSGQNRVILQVDRRVLGEVITDAFDAGQAQIRRPAAVRTR